MSEPFVGEIRMFAGNFAPRGWAFCDGQLLAVSQNDALFSLLGTIYGGDGRTTFGLPDLRGRIPIHAGHGPGLSERRLGAKSGEENVTLTTNQIPSHTHQMQASNELATDKSPQNNLVARTAPAVIDIYNPDGPPVALKHDAVTSVGGSRSHTNLQPFLCVHFIIALFGIYPSRH
ncbi:phage tail protein [Gilvimarinus algae]|uniref:Tail fiber protein n=1 Tax=Gilvimarinus algae TaxID=3058037 RepID=A0ABT8TG30_9GAMM|nr:tail fiber protein [Gilvimarinus sp. SDUM040014]MDO3383024.1 tail fiber protein [Gilvimarinus sp. SDUM040014]